MKGTSSGIQREIADTPCLINAPEEPLARLVLAHGAGAPMDSAFMESMAELLCERAIEVVRFEFPYMAKRREAGRKAPPNRQPILLETWQKLIAALAQEQGPPLVIGGKSMGGRMASIAAIEHAPLIKAVVCLGYPFHPTGKPEKQRIEHLHEVQVPILVVQGTRDTMGNQHEIMEYALPPTVKVVWLETANHDLKPLRKSGYTQAGYLEQTADNVAAFIAAQLN